MASHKTFGGMAKAVEREIKALECSPISDDREYQRHDKTTSGLMAELNALWSNPADVAEARRLKNRLAEAWHKATN